MYTVSNDKLKYLEAQIDNPNRKLTYRFTKNNEPLLANVILDSPTLTTDTGLDQYGVGTVLITELAMSVKSEVSIIPRDKITIEVGIDIYNEVTKTWETLYVPMGTYYVDTIEEKGMRKSIKAYDGMYKLNVGYFPSSKHTNTLDIANDIANTHGYNVKGMTSISIDNSQLEGKTCLEMLRLLAGVIGGHVRISRDSTSIEFIKPKNYGIVYDNSDYKTPTLDDTTSYNITKLIINYSDVVTDDEGNTTDEGKYEVGSGNDSHTLSISNPLLKTNKTQANAILNDIKSLNGYKRFDTILPLGDFRLDVMDIVTFVKGEIEYINPFLYMKMTLTYKGISIEVQSPTIAETKSEFSFKGTLSQKVENIYTDIIQVKQLTANKVSTDELEATVATIEKLYAQKAEIEDLYATKAEIGDLVAGSIVVEDLKAQVAQVEDLLADKANITDLNATNATINNLETDVAEIDKALINKANITDLNATNATISNLKSDVATINNAVINKAEIKDLEALSATINSLKANVAEIDNLISDSIISEIIQSGSVSSDLLNIKNGFIKDAMIDSVTASKINSGVINTNNVTIQSSNGNMKLQGNLLQFKDKNGKVRIQIGQDTSGNYTFTLYDSTGTGVLINEKGIQSSNAIKDGLIVDSKVASNANISGSKLNISSVYDSMNANGSKTLKASKVYLDDKKQTLDVSFKEMTTKQDELEDSMSTTITDLSVEKGKISQLIQDTTITTSSGTTKLKDAYSKLEQNVNGISATVGKVESTVNTHTGEISSVKSDVSTIKADLNEINLGISSVEQKVDGIKVGDRNLLLNSGNEVSNNSYNTTNYVPSSPLVKGETYTIVMCVTPAKGVASFRPYLSSGYTQQCSLNVSGTEKQIVTGVFKANYYTNREPSDNMNYAHVNIYRFPNNGTVTSNSTIHWCKIVKGNKASLDWTPAPEDVDSNIQGAITESKEYTNSQIKATKDAIELSVSSTYETKTNVSSKISSTLTSAKSYADTKKSEAISTASSDATSKANNALSSAKSYTDTAKNALSTEIGKKANSSDVYTKTQVYTKTETDSAIKLSKDSIELGISQKYETKEEVTNKVTTAVNNIQIGGTNLLSNSTGDRGTTGWSGLTSVVDGVDGHKALVHRRTDYSGTSRSFLHATLPYGFKAGDVVTYSGYYYIPSTVTFDANGTTIHIRHYYSGGFTDICSTAISTSQEKDKWIRFSATSKITVDSNSTKPTVYGVALAKNGEVRVSCLKVEKGNRATSWSPSESDINSSIQSVSNSLQSFENTVNGTFKNGIVEQAEAKAIEQNINILNNEKADIDKEYASIYNNANLSGTAKTNLNSAYTSYTSAHTSLISTINTAIADGKTTATEKASVNSTFTTYKGVLATYKQRVQEALDYISTQKVGNIQVGGRNLFKNSKTILLNGSDNGNRNCSVIENDYVKITPKNNGNVYNTGVQTYETRLKGVTYTLSFDVLTPTKIGFYWYPSEKYTKGGYIESSDKWQRISFTYTQTGDDQSNADLFGFLGLIGGQVYKYKNLQLEVGNKATQWTPAPEDVDTSISNAQTNAVTTSKSYTDSQIKLTKESIELGVSQTYETKTNVSSQVSTALTSAKSYTDTAKNELNTSIGKKANSADVYTKTEVYTKTQTDSAIKATKDSIDLSIKSVDEKATSVQTTMNNLTLGGRNLISRTYISKRNTTGSFDETSNTWTLTATANNNDTWGCGLIVGGKNVLIPYGKTFTLSFEIKVPQSCTWNNDVNNYAISGSSWNGNDNDDSTKRKYSSRSIPANQWVKCWFSYTNTSVNNTNKVDLYDNSNFGVIMTNISSNMTFYIRNIQGELSNIPSDWSPCPIDVQSDINTAKTDAVTNANSYTNNQIATVNKTIDSKVADIKLTTDSITQRVEKTETSIKEISIGGVNLLTGTKTLSGWGIPSGATTNQTQDGFNVYYNKFTPSGTTYKDFTKGSVITPKPNATYTLSFWAKGSGTIISYFYPSTVKSGVSSQGNTTTESDGRMYVKLSDTWTKHWITWTTLDNVSGSKNIIVCRQINSSSEAYIYGIKFEEGNKATSWSENPNTIDTNISNLTTRMSTAEQKITSDAIVSTVTSSTTYKNNLTGKVDKTSIISSINQTAEAVKISANKIQLDGNTTISAINAGSTTINGSRIQTGSITANHLAIGVDGGYARNADFSRWTSTYPDGTAQWSSSAMSKVAVDGKNVVQFSNTTASTQTGMHLYKNFFIDGINLSGVQYVCIEAKVRVTTGNFNGSAVLMDIYRTDGTYERLQLNFSDLGTPVANQWYTHRKIFKLNDANVRKTFRDVSGYALANWSSGGGGNSVKTMQFAYVNFYRATQQDYLTQTWTNGTEINGGSIKTGTITADKLNANVLSASTIVSTINGGSTTINGSKIKAGTITSTNNDLKFDLDKGIMEVYHNGTKLGSMVKNYMYGKTETHVYGLSMQAQANSFIQFSCFNKSNPYALSTHMVIVDDEELIKGGYKRGVNVSWLHAGTSDFGGQVTFDYISKHNEANILDLRAYDRMVSSEINVKSHMLMYSTELRWNNGFKFLKDGTTGIKTNGTLSCTSLTQTSDERYKMKTGVVDTNDCYEMVKNIPTYQYCLLPKSKDDMTDDEIKKMAKKASVEQKHLEFGVMAQDMMQYKASKYIISHEETIDEETGEVVEDRYSINPYGFSTAILGGLQKEIQVRDEQYEELKQENETLKNELAEIKRMLMQTLN